MLQSRCIAVVVALAASTMAAAAQEARTPVRHFHEDVLRRALAVAPRAAQPETKPDHSWTDLVRAAKPGMKVEIALANATSVEGRLHAVDAASITIEQAQELRRFTAGDVVRVRQAGVRTRHVLYGMLLGSIAGAVGLVAIDQASSHPSTKAEAATVGALVVGLPLGAVTGAVLPIGAPLYERRR